MRGMQQDDGYETVAEYRNNYRSVGHGDSGGPIMTTVIDRNGDKRVVQVAVAQSGWGITNPYLDSIINAVNTKCINQVTKITEEVVQWIKELEEGNYCTGKNKIFLKFDINILLNARFKIFQVRI